MPAPRAYYNEHDPFAAAWLRELIKADKIAPGDIDERDIRDVLPGELAGYTQHHFFAGIGAWSYALRLADWPDDKPVWTGSCPCQSFSTAGRRAGFADERHLWPSWFWLIEQRRPVTVFGEQVDAAVRQGWLDLVQSDMEGIGYTSGAVSFPAAGVGAPHIRQRVYFVAESSCQFDNGCRGAGEGGRNELADGSANGKLADTSDFRCLERGTSKATALQGKRTQREEEFEAGRDAGKLPGRFEGLCGAGGGCWSDLEYLPCRDGKLRPTQPGLFPLAHGIANRVGKLRGYGNAIVAPQAEAFIRAYMHMQGQE